MPQITTIRVVRRRSVQPEQYGNAAAEVELTGNVLEGEDPVQVARQMLMDSRSLVYENLGMKLPKSVVADYEEVDAPTETATATIEKTKEPAAEGGKKRGRPKGSGKKKTEESAPSDSDALPSDDSADMNIRNNPEDRQNPEDEEIPGEDTTPEATEPVEPVETELTALDLHNFINDSIKAAKLTVMQAKQMQKEMGIARVRDLDTPEKVAKAHNTILLAIKANENK